MFFCNPIPGQGTPLIPGLADNAERIHYLANRPDLWDAKGASELFAGVDLGTSMVKVVVVDQDAYPRAVVMKEANVVKSGLVLDYSGALSILRGIISELRDYCSPAIEKAATSYPPNTEVANVNATKYILEGAELEVLGILDEPTAANKVLGLSNGAIVDVGGGTTGISVIRNGKVIYTDDSPTGGVHLSLVLAGHLGISYEEAEALKKDKRRAKEIFPIVKPVIEKISSIISTFLRQFDWIDKIYLVGGTCELPGFADIVRDDLGIVTEKPLFPQVITPYGIALSCLSPGEQGDN